MVMGLVTMFLGGCPGETALDRETAVGLIINTPELEGEIDLSEQDASALGLDQQSWPIGEGPGFGSTVLSTGLRQTADQAPEYCFSQPVTVTPLSGTERVLIQADECFVGTTVMDRVGVEFVAPESGAVVGDIVEVHVLNEVGTADSTVRFYVDGEQSTHGIDAQGRAALDLSEVDAGPVLLRVEDVRPSGRVSAASVVQVVKSDTEQ